MRQDFRRRDVWEGGASSRGSQQDFLETLRTAPLGELNVRLASLTPQEQSILGFIVRGHCNKDICRALGIEVTTTKVHASRIFRKLGVKNRVQAAVLQLWTLLLSDEKAPPGHTSDKCAGSGRAASSCRPGRRPGLMRRETRLEARSWR
jgi:DNA-binding CsgD family transcriptional regulator